MKGPEASFKFIDVLCIDSLYIVSQSQRCKDMMKSCRSCVEASFREIAHDTMVVNKRSSCCRIMKGGFELSMVEYAARLSKGWNLSS